MRARLAAKCAGNARPRLGCAVHAIPHLGCAFDAEPERPARGNSTKCALRAKRDLGVRVACKRDLGVRVACKRDLGVRVPFKTRLECSFRARLARKVRGQCMTTFGCAVHAIPQLGCAFDAEPERGALFVQQCGSQRHAVRAWASSPRRASRRTRASPLAKPSLLRGRCAIAARRCARVGNSSCRASRRTRASPLAKPSPRPLRRTQRDAERVRASSSYRASRRARVSVFQNGEERRRLVGRRRCLGALTPVWAMPR